MANYETVVVSKGTKVKSPKEFVQVFKDLGFEETQYVESNDTVYVGSYEMTFNDDMKVLKKDGKVVGGVDLYNGMYDNFEDFATEKGLEGTDEGEYETIDLVKYIQEQLQDGNYFHMTEVGHEKLRYADGLALVITKDEIKYLCLNALVDEYLEKAGF